MNLQGKRIVITGANGGLGKITTQVAKSLGAEVVLLDVRFDGESGDPQFTVDLTSLADTRACFDKIGSFNAIFNLAGGFTMGPTVYESTDEEWDHLFNLNVKTMHNVVRAAIPKLLAAGGRSSIVNVGAIGAHKGAPNMSTYVASKAVVMRMTESLSEEVKAQGINVNAILPSVIDTAPNRAAMADADYSQWVTPEQLANVACFLASDAASGVHGALIPVAALS